MATQEISGIIEPWPTHVVFLINCDLLYLLTNRCTSIKVCVCADSAQSYPYGMLRDQIVKYSTNLSPACILDVENNR